MYSKYKSHVILSEQFVEYEMKHAAPLQLILRAYGHGFLPERENFVSWLPIQRFNRKQRSPINNYLQKRKLVYNANMLSILYRQKITFLFSVIFLFSIIIIGFHHHEDSCRHSDCPICVASGPCCCAGADGDAGFAFQQDISYLYSYTEIIHISLSIFPTFAYRAPPSASQA
jgi:hypothetical protein